MQQLFGHGQIESRAKGSTIFGFSTNERRTVIRHLNHTQLALVVLCFRNSRLQSCVIYKANDGVVYAIRAWFKYDTALSAVV